MPLECRVPGCTRERKARGVCGTHHQRALRARRKTGLPLLVAGLGTTRRVQALIAVGWTLRRLERLTGLSTGRLSELAHGHQPMVSVRTAAVVDRVYRSYAWERQSGTWADRARAAARTNGWAPALFWGDIDTDPEPEEVG